jgi:hypothetical protein
MWSNNSPEPPPNVAVSPPSRLTDWAARLSFCRYASFTHRMDTWSLQNKKFHDKKGGRWYFMFHHRYLDDRAPGEQPFALHFRDDERTFAFKNL